MLLKSKLIKTLRLHTLSNKKCESWIEPKYDYGEKDYWDFRYKGERESEEWYKDHSGLKAIFSHYMKDKSQKILDIGAGNSDLSIEIYKEGFENIVGIDFSYQVAVQMIKRIEQLGLKISYLEMDAKEMTFKNEEFDVIIDKGTLDSVICTENDDVYEYLQEIYRVQKKGGTYFCISHSEPESRQFLFEYFGWDVKVYNIPKGLDDESRKELDEEIPKELKLYDEHQFEERKYFEFKERESIEEGEEYYSEGEVNKMVEQTMIEYDIERKVDREGYGDEKAEELLKNYKTPDFYYLYRLNKV